ncbi:hypothetical protein ACN9MH_09810 [Paenibacillus silvae]|jgi:hypothetical protein|nr:hypothetical protein [Paenibacillus barcinonensis]MBU5350727.1 hypothetical protein [Paenibacillus barcinonensis]
MELSKGDLTLDEIEDIIHNYYKTNPAPISLARDELVSIQDVFPEEINENQFYNQEKFEFNEFINQHKESGEVISFSSETTKTDVFIDRSGVFILNSEIEPYNSLKSTSWSYTPNQRTSGTAYNALGLKMFELWASGSFRYDGSKVEVATKDGGYERKFWGSTLELTDRGMGLSRNLDLEGYKYAEVYSRLRTESTLGFRWFGLTVTDTTVEVKIGSTVGGNVYTGGGSI